MRRWLVPWLAACGGGVPAGEELQVDTDAGREEVPWVAGDQPGPLPVGATTRTVERDGAPSLLVEVWYPAELPTDGVGGTYGEGILSLAGRAFRDARPDARGPFPVVLFSHGFGGLRFQSAFLCEHLASHGFVVVAPDHPGSALTDLDPGSFASAAARRPTDLVDALEALEDVDDLAVETARLGVVGHSFGAWTALVLGGGQLDAEGFTLACAAERRPACAFLEGQSLDADEVAAFARPDPRVVATVALAPGAWYAFGQDGSGLSNVRAPLVIGGTRDGDLPWASEGEPTWEHLGAPRSLALLQGAGHWSFTDLCALLPIDDCAGAAGGFMEPARVQELVRRYTTAHLRLALLQDARDVALLSAQDDVTWAQEP